VALEDDRSAEVDAVFAWHPLPGSYDVGPFRLASYDLPHWVPGAGVRLECDEFTVAYSGDSGPSDRLVDLAAGTDLFVCEASDRHQQAQVPRANEPGLHLDARGAAEAASAARARRLLLTHFWPGNDRERTRREAAAVFDGPVELADEGLVLSLP
jgi:ribonuclease BN (tRNA processing enzyme)